MKFMYATVLALALTACGQDGAMGPQGPAGQPAAQPVVTPVQAQIDAIVANENEYRASLGQAALTKGLSCTVQAISGGTFLSSASPGYTAPQAIVVTGTSYAYLLTVGFNQPDAVTGPNNILDVGLQPLFEGTNYKVSCTGQLIVTDDGYASFSMSSDDGSILTVDGATVINNDGNHGVTTKVGTKALRSDIAHTFSLSYAQSGGSNFAMVLKMNGSVISGDNFFH